MRFYRPVSLSFAVIFAVVGILFLTIPDGVQEFFNTLSDYFNMHPMTVTGFGFYQMLAAGYMYAVTVLAFMMYRHPEDLRYPMLLMNFKFASSFLSLIMFIVPGNYLMYLVNFIIDALIGLTVLYFYLKLRKQAR